MPDADAPLVLSVLRRVLAVDARDRVFILAGQSFIALVPLAIVVASFGSSLGSDAIGNYLVRRFDLTGSSAEAVRVLFTHPPDAAGGIGIFSMLVLLVSLMSLSRSLRRTIEMAWEQDKIGFRGTRDGLLGVLVVVLMITLLAGIGTIGRQTLWLAVPALIIQFGIGFLGWWFAQYYFLTRRIAPRKLVPGAIVGASAQLLSAWVSSIYMPHQIAVDAARYGVIGVSFALVSWLIILAVVFVTVAVLGAELGRRTRSSRR